MTKFVLKRTELSEEKRLLGLCLCLDHLESWTRSQANRAPWTCLNTAWEGLKNNKQTGKTMSIWWQASEQHVAAVEWLVAVKSPLEKKHSCMTSTKSGSLSTNVRHKKCVSATCRRKRIILVKSCMFDSVKRVHPQKLWTSIFARRAPSLGKELIVEDRMRERQQTHKLEL